MKRIIIGLAGILSTMLLLTACTGPSQQARSSAAVSSEALPSVAASSGTSSSKATSSMTSESSAAKQTLFGDFKTQTLAGGECGPELFADHTLTMVNFWATFCSPCLDEMPDLAELHTEYAEQGFQVVGVVSDVLDADASLLTEQVDLAKQLVEQTGAAYTHLLPTSDAVIAQAASLPVVPITVFVNQNGDVVGEVYPGGKSKEDWAAVIESLLKDVDA